MPQIYSKRAGTRRTPRSAVDVTRPSPWGNPFVVGRDGTQRECVQLYNAWIDRPEQATLRERMRRDLAGHDLVCACGEGEPCHAHIVMWVANS
jgi:Domain of unknown function (DUF4326)